MKALKILKINKAPGPDRIPGEAIKSSPQRILNVILKLMNKIKNSTEYPEKWAEGHSRNHRYNQSAYPEDMKHWKRLGIGLCKFRNFL